MRKLILILAVLCPTVRAVFAQTGGGQQSVTVTLGVADLQGLRDTPIVLVPAPGSGMAISPISATLQYNFVTHNYAGGHGRFILTLGSYASDDPILPFDNVNTAGFIDQDSDQTVSLNANPLDPSLRLENLDLEIVNFGPPLIDGDGTLTVTVNYTVVAAQ